MAMTSMWTKWMLWSVGVLMCLTGVVLTARVPAAKLEAGAEEAKLSDILKEMQAYKDLYNADQGMAEEEVLSSDGAVPQMVQDWPVHDSLKLGQIGGVSMTSSGHVAVFHRGTTVWNRDTFDRSDNYMGDRGKPIPQATVVLVRQSDGLPAAAEVDPQGRAEAGEGGVKVDQHAKSVEQAWGADLFFMPHGLTVDRTNGDYWLTDVALHQVFKFTASDRKKPALVIGERFKPAVSNHDKRRFCKPTSVVVSPNGDVFIADGYCNSRVVRFNSKGEYLSQMGSGYFSVPHSIVAVPELSMLCVADRENKRVLCFSDGSTSDEKEEQDATREYTAEGFLGRVFALAYSHKRGALYAINGPTEGIDNIGGVTIDLLSNDQMSPITSWGPSNGFLFTAPHTMTISEQEDSLYIGETQPNELWKFNITAGNQ